MAVFWLYSMCSFVPFIVIIVMFVGMVNFLLCLWRESKKLFRFYVYSMDAYKALKEKDARLLDLQRRRKQLAALLAEERDQLHVNLHLLKLWFI